LIENINSKTIFTNIEVLKNNVPKDIFLKNNFKMNEIIRLRIVPQKKPANIESKPISTIRIERIIPKIMLT
jgi:hypothetical protein